MDIERIKGFAMGSSSAFDYIWKDIDFDEEFLNLENELEIKIASLVIVISLNDDLKLNYLILTENGNWFHYVKGRYDYHSEEHKYACMIRFIVKPGLERRAWVISFPSKVDGVDIEEIYSEFMFHNLDIVAVELPSKVKIIHDLAFFQCEQLEEVRFPKSLVRIGKAAFMNCSNLQAIEFAEGLEIIDDNAFWSCNKLKTINIPKTVKKIGGQAFKNCKLKEVLIRGAIETVDKNAFEGNPLYRLSIWSDHEAHIADQLIDGYVVKHSGIMELSLHNCILEGQIMILCSMEHFERIVCVLTGYINGFNNLPHNYKPLKVITNEPKIKAFLEDYENYFIFYTKNIVEEKKRVIGKIIDGKKFRRLPFKLEW